MNAAEWGNFVLWFRFSLAPLLIVNLDGWHLRIDYCSSLISNDFERGSSPLIGLVPCHSNISNVSPQWKHVICCDFQSHWMWVDLSKFPFPFVYLTFFNRRAREGGDRGKGYNPGFLWDIETVYSPQGYCLLDLSSYLLWFFVRSCR